LVSFHEIVDFSFREHGEFGVGHVVGDLPVGLELEHLFGVVVDLKEAGGGGPREVQLVRLLQENGELLGLLALGTLQLQHLLPVLEHIEVVVEERPRSNLQFVDLQRV